jgi:RimJ/RimL family protein N-acetyltransferase
MSVYPPLGVRVVTPALELRGATDDLLERLAPLVRTGKANADPPPWDDPCSFYEEDPDKRVEGWLRAAWRNRGTVRPGNWRLSFAVVVDDQPIGVQDLTGHDFEQFGTVESTSWVSSDVRRHGFGTETRAAILHLAFEGLGAAEAHSESAVDNEASNRISERLGYERNGTSWATHQGRPVLGQRWILRRSDWEARRRPDITMFGVEAARASLGID